VETVTVSPRIRTTMSTSSTATSRYKRTWPRPVG
jgi:hypothetical protein